MKVAVFDSHTFDKNALDKANNKKHELVYFDVRLSAQTAELAKGCAAACLFANDRADREALDRLKAVGIKIIALRSAGFNHVDIKHAAKINLPIVRVPAYSPYAVAEYAVALLQTLNRKTHKAYNRVREMNFSLDGLVGFDLHSKTVGVVGTGKIGRVFAEIMRGFGCRVIAHDKFPELEWAKKNSVEYCELAEILKQSQVVSLHVPLTPETKHMIDQAALALMRPEAIIINTGRGALVEAKALIQALKKHSLAGAALDVYEEEAGVFFSDFSLAGIDDDLLARLLTFPNVLITSHQAFLTHEALHNIATTTIENLTAFEDGKILNEVIVS